MSPIIIISIGFRFTLNGVRVETTAGNHNGVEDVFNVSTLDGRYVGNMTASQIRKAVGREEAAE